MTLPVGAEERHRQLVLARFCALSEGESTKFFPQLLYGLRDRIYHIIYGQ